MEVHAGHRRWRPRMYLTNTWLEVSFCTVNCKTRADFASYCTVNCMAAYRICNHKKYCMPGLSAELSECSACRDGQRFELHPNRVVDTIAKSQAGFLTLNLT